MAQEHGRIILSGPAGAGLALRGRGLTRKENAMAFDAHLADRLRAVLGPLPGLVEKRMFGGVGYMLHGNLAFGVHGAELIVRLSPEEAERRLQEAHTRPFGMGGRAMPGWILVAPEGVKTKAALERWVRLGLDYAATLPPKG
jgi:hypothetical protein